MARNGPRDFDVAHTARAISKRSSLSCLEKVNSSYVSEDLRTRSDDVVWRVRWRRGGVPIYVVIEFQSSNAPLMSLRVLTYVALLYQDYAREHRNVVVADGLPPVLPIVLYNGEVSWTAAQDLNALLHPVPQRSSPTVRARDICSLTSASAITQRSLDRRPTLRPCCFVLRTVAQRTN